MYTHRSEFPQRRSMYTAKTMNMHADEIAQAREEEALEWGTMDQAPARAAQPVERNPMLDWGIAIGLLGILAGATGIAAMTIVAAGTAIAIKTNPDVAAASLASLRAPAETQQITPLPIEPTAPAVAAASTPAKPEAKPARKAPAKPRARKRTRPAPRAAAPTPAPTRTPAAAPPAPAPEKPPAYGSMSLSQLKGYLGQPATPAPAPAAPATPPPAPAPATPPPDVDDELDALIAEPVPSASPVSSAMAARSAGTSRPAPAPTPPANNGYKQLSTRLAKAPNGVLVLDEPFDPVPVAITTDAGAAVYVDGELLGGAPIAVVVDRGSHEVTIQAEKGTVAFDVDASEGSKWCFSVKRTPKMDNCK